MSTENKNDDIASAWAKTRYRRSPELDGQRAVVLFPRKVARSKELLDQVIWD